MAVNTGTCCAVSVGGVSNYYDSMDMQVIFEDVAEGKIAYFPQIYFPVFPFIIVASFLELTME
jgi:hypothetical protein